MDEQARRAPHGVPLQGELYPSGRVGITVAGHHVATVDGPDIGAVDSREQVEHLINVAVAGWLRRLTVAAPVADQPELAPGAGSR